jgi:hypothetical protein
MANNNFDTLQARLREIALERIALADEVKYIQEQLRRLKRQEQLASRRSKHICLYGSCTNKTSPHITLKRQGQYYTHCDEHRAMRNKYILRLGRYQK